MNRLILIVFVLGLMHGALAQPSLVKNINTTTATGGLEFSGAMAVLNGDLYFGAKAQGDGYELWKSSASGGAVMVTNLPGDPGINSVYNFNGTLYFMATNAATGTELWKSNGTEAGTMMVKDIWPGTTGGCAQTLGIVNIGNAIYFAASDGAANGFELWKSDGTPAGTTMVKNINASGSGFSTGNYSLIAIGATLYFTASDGSTVGTELYKSDGTAANTVLVKDVNPSIGGNGTGGNFTNFNGKLLFSGSDGTNGVEPWISDGTAAGTVMIKNIAAVAASSVSLGQEYTVSGSYAYFAAQEAVNGVELWRTDGTAAGTTLVKDIYAGASNHGAPSGIVNVNGVLYFTAQDGSGFELWKSDGTAANTQLVKDIASGAGSSYPSRFSNQLSGKVFFTATEASTGTELWETDGTAAGTQLVYDINPLAPASTPRGLQVIGNQLLFTADDGVNGIELWSYTPGTPLAVPNTITTLVAAVRNANSIKLTWTDSDTETKYEIERSAGNASSFVKIAGADADINQYTATSLIPGTIYYFRIRQQNAAGYSSYSNVVSETIPVIPFPTIASMQLSSPNTLHLTWSDVPGLSGYNIERSIGNNTSYVQYTQIQSTYSNEADITGLTPGTTYYVRMNSYTVFPGAIVVTSAYSNEVSKLVPVSAPPAAPTGLTASINGSAVTLNWNDMPAESSYIIERSVNNTTSFSVVNNPAANATQYIDNGITPGNTYYYRLAYVQAGQTSFYSQYTNYPSVISIPTVPQNVVATATGPNEITLTWDEPSTATHYWLMWGSPSPVSIINPVSGNSRVFDGLEANTTYYFKILAVNATGESAYSTVANATTPTIIKVNSILINGAGNAATITSNGGTLQMSVTVLPANAADKTVTWSVSNGSGSATITPSGLLTATGNGTVTVNALANDGSAISDAKVVNISGQIVLASSIVVTGAANATMISTSGGTLQMNAAVLPASTTNKAVTWSVTNITGSATITTAGLLTATGNGTVTVKAVAKDGSATNGTIVITISGQPASILVTSILVTGNDISVNGGTSQMNAAVSPGNSTVSSVTWSVVPGTGSATISATGLLTAISNGTVTVKAAANDVSTVIGTKTITIYNQKILVSSIVVNSSGNAAGIYTVAGTLQMSAVVLPLNATDKTITWSVINGTGSAVISSNGLLTATGNGTVTVKASANDASEVTGTKIFTISGQAPSVLVTSILVSGADISVPGGTSQMAASLLPANATVMSVTWYVINGTGKATISNTGLLTATDNGTVTVKAQANDASGISDTHVVTISGQSQTVLVTSIQIVGEDVLVGNSAVMTAALLPLHATVQSVTWSVVNGVGSATIDPATGELKALLAGTVTIKALANDGSMVTGTKVICILPAVPVITVDFKDAASPVLVSSSSSGNQWFLNGTPIIDATHTTYTAIQPGLYTLQVTAESCQSALSEASEIVVTGLNKEEVAVSVVCVPNPASEFITIHAPVTSYTKVFIYNLRGQMMMSGGSEYLNQSLSISDYPEGIYFARLQLNETTVVRKFIKK